MWTLYERICSDPFFKSRGSWSILPRFLLISGRNGSVLRFSVHFWNGPTGSESWFRNLQLTIALNLGCKTFYRQTWLSTALAKSTICLGGWAGQGTYESGSGRFLFQIRFWPVRIFTGSVRPFLNIPVLAGSVPRFRSGPGSIMLYFHFAQSSPDGPHWHAAAFSRILGWRCKSLGLRQGVNTSGFFTVFWFYFPMIFEGLGLCWEAPAWNNEQNHAFDCGLRIHDREQTNRDVLLLLHHIAPWS